MENGHLYAGKSIDESSYGKPNLFSLLEFWVSVPENEGFYSYLSSLKK